MGVYNGCILVYDKAMNVTITLTTVLVAWPVASAFGLRWLCGYVNKKSAQ